MVERHPVYTLNCIEEAVTITTVAKIQEFYESNPNEFVSERSTEELLTHLKDSGSVYIEAPDGRVVACSLTIKHNEDYSEVGGVLSILPSFQFQCRMQWYQLIASHYISKPNIMMFSVIDKKILLIKI